MTQVAQAVEHPEDEVPRAARRHPSRRVAIMAAVLGLVLALGLGGYLLRLTGSHSDTHTLRVTVTVAGISGECRYAQVALSKDSAEKGMTTVAVKDVGPPACGTSLEATFLDVPDADAYEISASVGRSSGSGDASRRVARDELDASGWHVQLTVTVTPSRPQVGQPCNPLDPNIPPGFTCVQS